MSENLASKPMPMSFLPAGMPTYSAKPMGRQRPAFTQKETKIRRPVAESIKQCNRLQPAQYIYTYIYYYICKVETYLVSSGVCQICLQKKK